MIYTKTIQLLSVICLLASCTPTPVSIHLTNNLSIERQNETVEVLIADLPELLSSKIDKIGVYDPSENTFLTTQLIDIDQDGKMDQLIFQPQLAPSSEKTFHLKEQPDKPEAVEYCFSRIVPTRIDDYTWENDKVAFRTYGPRAQALVEEGKEGGIISSGIDCWLKKVSYPVINKWYKASEEDGISYHEDHGEGLDNYHVGISRGAGGLAIKGAEDQYFVSKNFTTHKTLASGPLRTLFQFDYADWQGPQGMIKEQKTISLDYGNNLMKIEVSIQGTDHVAAGISLQENNGTILDKNNILIFKQNHFETTLSNVILTPQKYFKTQHLYNPQIKDQNHVFLDLKILNQSLVYYVGFYWSESKQFADHQAWEKHLDDLAIKIENPIQLNIN
tara:strand:- start:84327 stop:85493 length:1167 start_codon:yes stop_codon:yes gene_type:complete